MFYGLALVLRQGSWIYFYLGATYVRGLYIFLLLDQELSFRRGWAVSMLGVLFNIILNFLFFQFEKMHQARVYVCMKTTTYIIWYSNTWRLVLLKLKFMDKKLKHVSFAYDTTAQRASHSPSWEPCLGLAFFKESEKTNHDTTNFYLLKIKA